MALLRIITNHQKRFKTMGYGRLLSFSEGSEVIKQLGKNISIATIAQKLGRDVRTVKNLLRSLRRCTLVLKGPYKVRIKIS